MAQQRALMALVGGLAAASLFLLLGLFSVSAVPPTLALAILVADAVFFVALLSLAGPMELPRAAPRAALQGLVVGSLVAWASTRFERIDDLLGSPLILASTLVLTLIPLPFILAEDRTNWRDYPELFSSAWAIVMRSTVAWAFTGLLWAMIWLCHALLSLVGIDLIGQLIGLAPVPWLITGTAFGLAMAVALELQGVVSAALVLRLLRLLLPVVLVVLLVFLGAVVLRGMGALSGLSAGGLLLAVSVVAATLVTSVVDRSDAEAARSRLLLGAAQVLAALMILTAGLAAWSIWQRVASLGWTPTRLFAASLAVLALGYGLLYLAAILRGRRWMGQIRQANIVMALVLMAMAMLWLTPALNPERISAASQLARLDRGRTSPDRLDLDALSGWGKPGAEAIEVLRARAATDPALAAALARMDSGQVGAEPPDADRQRADLAAALSVQPASEAGFRDRILALAAPEDLSSWAAACELRLEDETPGCALVVADFLPDRPGAEGLLLLNTDGGYVQYQGLALDGGSLRYLSVDSDSFAGYDDGDRLIRALREGLPPLRPVPRNEMAMPFGGAISLKP